MLVVLPLMWAFFTGLTAVMSTVVGFILVRACLGLAEGLAVPAVFRVVGEAFEPKGRTGAMALSSTAGALGPALAGPIIGLVIASYGWRAAFYVMALPPVIAAVLIFIFLPSHKRSAADRVETPAPVAPHEEPARTYKLRNPALWAIAIAYFLFNVGYWGYNGWMPTYLASSRHIDIKHLGFIGAIPFALAFVGLLTFGWLGVVLHRLRAQMLAAAYLLTGVALYFAFGSQSLVGTMVGLCCASFFLSGGIPLFGSLLFELAPRGGSGSYAGIVFTSGQIGGVIAPFAIGRLVQTTGNFASGFALMEIALVLASVGIFLLPMLARGKGGAASQTPSMAH
jgi:ACS family hexuronate transporter-like MFS transporter